MTSIRNAVCEIAVTCTDDLDAWPWHYHTFAFWTIAPYLLSKTSSNYCSIQLRLWLFFRCKKYLLCSVQIQFRVVMFSAKLWKLICGHNPGVITFELKQQRWWFVSRPMFLGSWNQMELFMLSCIWPCLISDLWKSWNWSFSYLPKPGMS